MQYVYFINLDERGDFYADVRANDEDGQTVYEIQGMPALESLVEDGFMRHSADMKGLAEHLRDLGIMTADDRLSAAINDRRTRASGRP